jgi:hypothetical protein
VDTVSRLVLHPDGREVVAIRFQQGIVNRREGRAAQQGREM